jgi:hypothetical protein
VIPAYKPLQGNEIWSDEFAINDEISPHWSRLDSGTVGNSTMTHGHGWLSMRHAATGCGSTGYAHFLTLDLSAIGITPAVGFVMETYTRIMDRQDVNYCMSYTGLADGATVGAGTQLTAMTHTLVNGQPDVHGLRTRTGYNLQTAYTNFAYYMSHAAGFYTRIRYEAANTYRLYVSQNGLHWLGSGTYACTLTPTYLLLGATNWNTAVPSTVSFRYVRLYDSHNNPDPYDTL